MTRIGTVGDDGFVVFQQTGSTAVTYSTYGSILTAAKTNLELEQRHTEKGITARLYFKLVKSKLSQSEQDDLRDRIAKLQKIIKDTQLVGQTGLYEKSVHALVACVRELEAISIGCGRFVMKDFIEKYRAVRKDNGKSPVYFTPWHQFPRTAPKYVQDKILEVQEKKIFDSYHVLYLDYARDSKPIQSNKDKIKEKDPILFGCFDHTPDKFYFIVDWVDDFCDLTFSEFVKAVGVSKEETEVPELTKEYFEKLKKEAGDRLQRLKDTNRNNFKEKMAEEDKSAAVSKPDVKEDAPKKTPWYKRKLW